MPFFTKNGLIQTNGHEIDLRELCKQKNNYTTNKLNTLYFNIIFVGP